MIRLSGRLRSALIIGGQGIRARKLRALLSMLSLFLGVLAIVAVQAGSEIADRALLADVELAQGKDGTVQMYLPAHPRTIPIVLDTLKDAPDAVAVIEGQAIIGEPGVTPVNPGAAPFDQSFGGGSFYPTFCDASGVCYATGPVGGPAGAPPPGQAIELRLVGLTGDIRRFRPFEPDSGQWLDFTGDASLSPRLVINREALKGFTRHRVPAEMRLTGSTVNPTPRITGVVHDAGYGPTAYVRADELLNWQATTADPSRGGGPGVMVLLAPTATGIEQTLRARLAAAGAPMDQIYVSTINSREHFTDQLSLVRWIFYGMAILVLLIGVAGILNVGLATVGERVEEFALRRAVGTPRLLLAGIVLAETLFIGLFTALAAIGVGMVGLTYVGRAVDRFAPLLRDVTFPWQAGVAGVIAGVAAGLLGGLVPAVRAARIPIATVMRA
ncbi:MAG TPA: ABC transporter permease [Actinophytocola sp.]|uniref:ABC transporter permease n=1 Tax=Actinophytocola sp. TaxID=1872138 RepID=UPI002DDD6D67|nr:ABC transporter permease [Actinophytocola sp.]HEV2783982.1 ABC transporter permease [Actinophytocola sp.]